MSNSTFSEFWSSVNDGVQGKNRGLPTGYPRLEEYLNGIHKGRYYTVFSEGGTGKSSFVWSTFVINLLDYMFEYNAAIDANATLTDEEKKKKHIKVVIKLYSLEVVKREVVAKMVCLKIFKDYGLLVDVDYILSRIKTSPLKKLIYHLVKGYNTYFDEIERQGLLEIIDHPRNPSQIRQEVELHAKSNGSFYKNAKGDEIYKAHNPNEYVVVITDTVGNLVKESVDGHSSTKGTIDLHSANCRYVYRDKLNYIPINISHSNRAMSDMNRAKLGEVFPKLSDIKETNMLEQDSSVILTIFNPMNHIGSAKELEKFMGYDIKLLKERFRCVGVLKNRHGQVNKRVGLLYLGENGHFEELAPASSFTTDDYGKILNYQQARYMQDAKILSMIEAKNPNLSKELKELLTKK